MAIAVHFILRAPRSVLLLHCYEGVISMAADSVILEGNSDVQFTFVT